MPASAAQLTANRANAAKSTGPRTPEGKEASRANALKHGLTGAGLVLPERAAAETERRYEAMVIELNPSCEVGLALVRRVATMSVRMESSVNHQTAAQTARVRQALADFEAPEGADESEVVRLRSRAANLAMFDPSKEATLARKYELAAERSFFRALKELRLVEKQNKALDRALEAAELGEELGSFAETGDLLDELEALYADPAPSGPSKPPRRVPLADFTSLGGRVDVPITIGRRR